MRAQVSTGSRLHFGFLNLSLAHDRLYGGIGVALETPETTVTATRADSLDAPSDVSAYASHALTVLDVPGATIDIPDMPPRHVGLGSGTQLALAIYSAIGSAYDKPVTPRETAPLLDRGGRSGVGVAAFETGGFILDAGHPVERFTSDRPDRGDWTVPAVLARHPVPDTWRFLVIIPDANPGVSGMVEEAELRAVIETADPRLTTKISTCIMHRLLPAIATGNIERFGDAVSELGRYNGQWYAAAQGGVYRPPVGRIIDELAATQVVTGAGQSSWGPTVYGVTDHDRATAAREAATDALDTIGISGDVLVVRPRNTGAQITVP